MHLVDTNVLSELSRPRPVMRVVDWVSAQPTFAISVVSVEELSFGIARTKGARRANLEKWLEALLDSRVEILDVTSAIARAAGDLRARHVGLGRNVTQADMLIAATAVEHGLAIATRNVRDFVDCGVKVFDPFTV
jgi:predicted nucleic acid-binding protein